MRTVNEVPPSAVTEPVNAASWERIRSAGSTCAGFPFARAIARDLGAFVSSFERPPADVVDRWLRRFDEKYARDPSYFLKA